MNKILKRLITRFTPKVLIEKAVPFLLRMKTRRARAAFEQASDSPAWLEKEVLELLQERYRFPPDYSYDSIALKRRGKQRAREIFGMVRSNHKQPNSFLELGCMDGMVSCAIQAAGKRATAVDMRREAFDDRAVCEGVDFVQTDASSLGFQDESFDFIFSYNSFEHFLQPEYVLRESLRVLKQRGYIYLKFGPLYMSPFGMHAYRIITVPYCQFLFSKALLREFASVKGFGTMDFVQINEWPLQEYRKLFQQYSDCFTTIKDYESLDISALGLIAKYPSCFRSKTKCFDNLIVSSIEILLRKL